MLPLWKAKPPCYCLTLAKITARQTFWLREYFMTFGAALISVVLSVININYSPLTLEIDKLTNEVLTSWPVYGWAYDVLIGGLFQNQRPEWEYE